MLKEEREKRGIGIAELSRKSSVSRHIIYMIESRGHKAKTTTRYKLANALGVDVELIK